jgi:hypothetical protein
VKDNTNTREKRPQKPGLDTTKGARGNVAAALPPRKPAPTIPSTSSMSKNVKILSSNIKLKRFADASLTAVPVHVSDARYNTKDTGGTGPHLQQRVNDKLQS